jgi:hypothetical protein
MGNNFNVAALGSDPAGSVWKITGIIYIVVLSIIGLTWIAQPLAALPIILLTVIGTITMLPKMIRGAALTAGTQQLFNSAKSLIVSGKLDPAYVGRGVTCRGIAVVDEKNKQIFLNGGMCTFDQVKSITTGYVSEQSGFNYYVEIVIIGGANPVHKVFFDGEHSASTFYHRLSNTLNFT